MHGVAVPVVASPAAHWHLAYTLVRDLLGFLSPRPAQECRCHCSAEVVYGDCPALERLVREHEVRQVRCGSSWGLAAHCWLLVLALLLGFCLGYYCCRVRTVVGRPVAPLPSTLPQPIDGPAPAPATYRAASLLGKGGGRGQILTVQQ